MPPPVITRATESAREKTPVAADATPPGFRFLRKHRLKNFRARVGAEHMNPLEWQASFAGGAQQVSFEPSGIQGAEGPGRLDPQTVSIGEQGGGFEEIGEFGAMVLI